MKNFFVSYTSEDHGFANWLTGRLNDKGITHWFDDNLVGGFTPYQHIDENLDAATDLIVVLSANAINSQRVRTEIMSGLMANKNIIFLELEPVSIPATWQSLIEGGRAQVIRADYTFDVEGLLGGFPKGIPAMGEDNLAVDGETVFRDVSPREDDAVHERMEAEEEPVRFTTYHPQRVTPGQWHKLLAYVHLPGAGEAVKEDSRSILGEEAQNYGKGRGEATETILREAEITVVPEMPGCRFNPPRQTLFWLEDWHRADFRMQANPSDPDFETDNTVYGRVAFYVGPILVAETRTATYITEDEGAGLVEQPQAEATTEPYRDIFVSYSHQDNELVAEVEKHIGTLGDRMLRDVYELRSGEEWNPRLLELIEAADIFQLFWSSNAKASQYVEQEWRHALAQNRKYFIRPVFWEDPMPSPPEELGHIHFDQLKV